MRASPLTRRRLLRGTTIGLSMLAIGTRPAFSDSDPTQDVVARLCDIVIPDTDTPGARAAGVPAFLRFALSHDLFGGNAGTLAAFIGHLDLRAGGGGFLAADPATQIAMVTAIDHASFAREPPPPGISAPVDTESQNLWRIVKSGIVTGFYTSESGGSRTLTYDLVPGRYDSDIPLHSEAYLSNFWIENLF
jgi:hypothetical protein